jgi:hypothetical protein
MSLALIGAMLVACSAESRAPMSAAGLETVFDSTRADSVIARTAGEVPAERLRRVVDEVRIAPEADDTTLFAEVTEFDVGQGGELYVFDNPNRVLFIFDSTGALLRRVGRQGAGPGEFNSNNGMVVLRDGRLAQWDARNGRVSFFSAAGDFQYSWVVPTGFSTSFGIRTDTTGYLYAYRPVTPPRDGEILGRMGLRLFGDEGVLTDSLIPPDLPWTRVVYTASVRDNTSSTGPTHGARFQWQWHPHGYFVSVATERYQIELSRPDRPLRIVRDAPEIPVSDAERSWDQERITFNLRQTDPSWSFNGPPIPATKPPVAGLHVARDGRIWVRVAVPSVEIPEAEREAPRGPATGPRPPVRTHRDASTTFEVFAPSGEFLGRVEMPANIQWMEADGDRVWYIGRDADGLAAIVRARIQPGL